jgi:hypothetical protein
MGPSPRVMNSIYIYTHTHKCYSSPRVMITPTKIADQNVNHL